MAESFDPGIASIQLAGAQTNTEAINSSIASAAASGTGGTSDGAFNGTIGDLKTKYPEVYKKLVLEQIAMQIVQQCQHNNDRYIEEMKKHRDW